MKKEPVWVIGLLVCIFINSFTAYHSLWQQESFIARTNTLLPTFQRMDTVKDDQNDVTKSLKYIVKICPYGIVPEHGSWVCPQNPKHCDTGYLLIAGECVSTIGKMKTDRNSQNDPNLCKQWKTDCKDSPIGPQCDVKCTLDTE